MGIDDRSENDLREELANLKDDLAVLESGLIFAIGSTGDQQPVDQQPIVVIKRKIAALEAKLAHDDE